MNEQFPGLFAARAIAINHLGYETAAPKFGVLCLGGGAPFVAVRIISAEGGGSLIETIPERAAEVDGWRGQTYQRFDMSGIAAAGRYVAEAVDAEGDVLVSEPFEVADRLYTPRLSPLILGYFQSQRTNDSYTDADRQVPFVGNKRNSKADVHGGWYDASGDVSKYLSHLSYANFMNPQQTPLVVWALSKAAICPRIDERLHDAFRAEALYGADFLVRMCDPAGMFYMTVFDRWSGDTAQREICSYSTQKGHKHETWEAGYRQGGGMAIAALARAARFTSGGGEFAPQTYLETAVRAFRHLEHHNREYLDDGEENIIDDYCALLAATELARTTGAASYRSAAAKRARSLIARLSEGHGYAGWWRADGTGKRPFFHAAEEGMPIVALVDYLAIAEPGDAEAVRTAVGKAVAHIGGITGEVVNPFDYPRQLVRTTGGTVAAQFFFPHGNDSGYWWQGENARLASLAYAMRRARPHIGADVLGIAEALPQRCIDWILGANPFHSSMMTGVGRNVSNYNYAKFPHPAGGICNGITSSMNDEAGIAFCESEDGMHSWRWSEQWLPHAAWLLLALTEQ